MYFHIPNNCSFLFQQIFHLMFFFFFLKKKKTPIDDVAPQRRDFSIRHFYSLQNIGTESRGERFAEIFVTGNAAEEEEEREREEEREKKKKVRKHKPLGAQYSLVHSLLESFNKFI